jgi:hypothetical protein
MSLDDYFKRSKQPLEAEESENEELDSETKKLRVILTMKILMVRIQLKVAPLNFFH